MKQLSIITLLLILTACGGGGGSSDEPATEVNTENVLNNSSETIAKGILSVLIPSALADEVGAYTATVSVSNSQRSFEKTITSDDAEVVFSELVVGDYSVDITVHQQNTEIGTYSGSVRVEEHGETIEPEILVTTADLTVAPFVSTDYSVLNRTYEGEIRASGCFSTTFSTATATLDLGVDGDTVALTLSIFPDPVIQFTGTLDDSSGILKLSGTYDSSDFTEGTWQVEQVMLPGDGAIFLAIDMVNETGGDCAAAIVFAGL